MDGVYVQCPSTCPQCGKQCVRLADTHEEHQDQQARDVWCHRWDQE